MNPNSGLMHYELYLLVHCCDQSTGLTKLSKLSVAFEETAGLLCALRCVDLCSGFAVVAADMHL